jgi:hypothetical protein
VQELAVLLHLLRVSLSNRHPLLSASTALLVATMDQDMLDRLMAAHTRGKSEDRLRDYLAEMQERVEVEQERLQRMTDVAFHERNLERLRRELVRCQEKKARLQASGCDAEQLRRCDEAVGDAQTCCEYAERQLDSVRREPAVYAREMLPQTQLLIAQLQYCLSCIEARLEEMEQQRIQQELEKRRRPKQRAIPGH